MKLVNINGRFLSQDITGVQRFAIQLIQALDRWMAADPKLRARYTFRVLTPRGRTRSLEVEHISVRPVGRLVGNLWEQLELPVYTSGGMLLNLCNTAPVVRAAVVAIHDASVFAIPHAYSRAFRAWYGALLPFIGRRALRVLTDSRFSRSELSRWANIPEDKVEIVPLGGEHILETPADTSIFERLPVQPGRYILGVGSRSPHKNLAALVAAVARLGPDQMPLVVAGGLNPRIFGSVHAVQHGAWHDTGYVADGQLRALYENAACFVFPSLYEGFGLPPLEAMVCGCPAVVARAASLPEVCGDAVLYCNPQDPDDIAAQIRILLTDPRIRDLVRQRGAHRAGMFTWRRSAEALMQALDRVGTM